MTATTNIKRRSNELNISILDSGPAIIKRHWPIHAGKKGVASFPFIQGKPSDETENKGHPVGDKPGVYEMEGQGAP